MEKNCYQIDEAAPGILAIREKTVRMYLIKGEHYAVLLDTGFGTGDLKRLVKSLWDGPLYVINSHGHKDHAGGNYQFPRIYAHPSEWEEISRYAKGGVQHMEPLHEGDLLDLGGRCLEVIETPGHTPGAICLLDRANKIFFSGDNISDVPIYLCLSGANLQQYRESLLRIVDAAFECTILGCHGTMEQTPEQALVLVECVTKKINGELSGTTAQASNGESYQLYQWKTASFYGD